MRWVITLSVSIADVERLLAASIEGLSLPPTEAREVMLEFEDSFGDESTSETRDAVKGDIDLRVRHINGFGKLRWEQERGRQLSDVTLSGASLMPRRSAGAGYLVVGQAVEARPADFFEDRPSRLTEGRGRALEGALVGGIPAALGSGIGRSPGGVGGAGLEGQGRAGPRGGRLEGTRPNGRAPKGEGDLGAGPHVVRPIPVDV